MSVASPIVLLLALLGQATDAPDPAVEKGRRERLEAMKELLDAVALETAAEPAKKLTRSEQPVLRYTNPVRSSSAGGAMFLWLDGKRPLVAASISIRDSQEIFWEFASLADEPLQASREGKLFWTPKSAIRKSELLRDATEPVESVPLRLAQMRTLARRFDVAVEREKWQESRLLTQPLHRWQAPEAGVLDGALFGFTETTDPELLLMLEARRDDATQKYEWSFSLAKMTSPPVKVELDKKPLWSAGGYWRNPRSPNDSYMERGIGSYEQVDARN